MARLFTGASGLGARGLPGWDAICKPGVPEVHGASRATHVRRWAMLRNLAGITENSPSSQISDSLIGFPPVPSVSEWEHEGRLGRPQGLARNA